MQGLVSKQATQVDSSLTSSCTATSLRLSVEARADRVAARPGALAAAELDDLFGMTSAESELGQPWSVATIRRLLAMPPKRRRSPVSSLVAAAVEPHTDELNDEAKLAVVQSTLRLEQTCRFCHMRRPGCLLVLPVCGHLVCMACVNSDVAQQLMNPKAACRSLFCEIQCKICNQPSELEIKANVLTSAPGGHDFMLHKLALALNPEELPKYSCPLAHLCQFEPELSLFKFQVSCKQHSFTNFVRTGYFS